MAGERREFAGTVCEFPDRAQLLRGRRGDRLRLLGGRLGARARPLERLRVAAGELGDAARQLLGPVARARRAGWGLGEGVEVVRPGTGVVRLLARVGGDALEQLRRPTQRPPRLLGGLADVARLPAARLGELVYLVCDDGEAAAVHAGARRLDRRVEGEQVGLVGDEPDCLREALHLLCDIPQAAHFAGALFGRHAEVGQPPRRGVGRLADAVRGLLHLGPGLARLFPGRHDFSGALLQLVGLPGDRAHETRRLAGAVTRPLCRRGYLLAARMDLLRGGDRKSTRLNSSHSQISYAVFCLKKKKNTYYIYTCTVVL